MLCKIKFYDLILPKPLRKWLVEALFSVSTNYNHYNNTLLKAFYNIFYKYSMDVDEKSDI